jgi:hypothetical protein
MALSCAVKPDHSTIAPFLGRLQGRIEFIFSEILLVCYEEGLLAGSGTISFGLKDFSYDAKIDCFLCPAGKRLKRPRRLIREAAFNAATAPSAWTAQPARSKLGVFQQVQHPQEPSCSQEDQPSRRL